MKDLQHIRRVLEFVQCELAKRAVLAVSNTGVKPTIIDQMIPAKLVREALDVVIKGIEV